MTLEEAIKKYEWNLPYTKKDVEAIYKEGYRQALQDVLKLNNGEVVNGVIKGVIETDKVRELL